MKQMKSLGSELETWREVEAITVTIGSIKTDEGFQPRNPRLTFARHAANEKRESERQIHRLRDKLTADASYQLDPLLVAMIDGKRYVVDGHHRLHAYRRAMRRLVPVRERPMTRQHAALLAQLVNLDGTKLPMTAGQNGEAAWQYIASVTDRGRLKLAEVGTSAHKVASMFGIGSSSVDRMVRGLANTREQVEANQYSHQACNPATGWPLWKYARGYGAGLWDQGDDSTRQQAKVSKCARALAKLREEFDAETIRQAMELLRKEAAEEAGDDGETRKDADDDGCLFPEVEVET
jgi:hypothetical protein